MMTFLQSRNSLLSPLYECSQNVVFLQVDEFLQNLITFDKEHIPDAVVKALKDDYLRDPEFNPEFVRTKSSAAAGLCAWVINIIKFHEVRLSYNLQCTLAPETHSYLLLLTALGKCTEYLSAPCLPLDLVQ